MLLTIQTNLDILQSPTDYYVIKAKTATRMDGLPKEIPLPEIPKNGFISDSLSLRRESNQALTCKGKGNIDQ